MDCRDCTLYDSESGYCKSRKLNPRTKEHAAEVVQMLGIRALCVFNEFREPAVQRMFDEKIRGQPLGGLPERPIRRRSRPW